MSEDSSILSLAQAAAALRAPAEDERRSPAGEGAGDENAHLEHADAEEGTELEIPAEAHAGDGAAETDSGAGEDAAARPSVDPPAGWSPDDQAWFKSLPPEKQEVIAKRERDFRAQESRRHNEHAEARKVVDAELTAARTERQNLSAALKRYADPLVAGFEKEFADLVKGETDAIRIQADDPHRFQRLQAYQAEFARLMGTQQALAQREAAESQQALEQWRASENAKFVELAGPDAATPEKLQSLDRDLTAYLRQSGASDERIRRASAVELNMARKAMLYDKAMAAKPAPKPVARVQQPGTGTTRGERAAGDRAAQMKRLERTGSIDDAIGLLRQ
jgi:hypothetical protein